MLGPHHRSEEKKPTITNVLLALILIRKFLINRAFDWEQHVPSIDS